LTLWITTWNPKILYYFVELGYIAILANNCSRLLSFHEHTLTTIIDLKRRHASRAGRWASQATDPFFTIKWANHISLAPIADRIDYQE
jgi:hypothetical protein